MAMTANHHEEPMLRWKRLYFYLLQSGPLGLDRLALRLGLGLGVQEDAGQHLPVAARVHFDKGAPCGHQVVVKLHTSTW